MDKVKIIEKTIEVNIYFSILFPVLGLIHEYPEIADKVVLVSPMIDILE